MPIGLKQIQEPIKNELKEFSEFFDSKFDSTIPLLNRVLKYIVKTKGKQMRPLFVLLSAALIGKINEQSYRAATLIELLHTATLVHDDVVDDSMKRRGLFSINALWKNKIAVLVGDFLLSQGLILSLENKDHKILEITSNAVKKMSEGELLQIEKARTLDIKEDVYFEIIQMKTASLIASSCAVGAASTSDDDELIDKMWTIGHCVGIAFQIRDDLLDFSQNNIGKPRGGDLKEKKLTLPLIYALNSAEKQEKKKIISHISKGKNNKLLYKEVIGFIEKYKGFEYAQNKMEDYKKQALDKLDEFPDSEIKTSIKELIKYSIDRKK